MHNRRNKRVEDRRLRPVQEDMWELKLVECGRLTVHKVCRLKYAVEGRRRGRGSRLVSGGREGLYLVW